jgi:hypothetical protein
MALYPGSFGQGTGGASLAGSEDGGSEHRVVRHLTVPGLLERAHDIACPGLEGRLRRVTMTSRYRSIKNHCRVASWHYNPTPDFRVKQN